MKDILKDLEDVQKVFDSFGVRMFIVYGALLGHFRDGKFLPGDDDIDIAIIDKIDFETRKKIGWKLYDLGFDPQPISFNVFGRMEPSAVGYNGDGESGIIVCERNFKFTIFFFKEEPCQICDGHYVCIPKLGAVKLISIPTRFFQKEGIIKIGRKKYLTPSPIKKYLEYSYKDWRDRSLRDHSPLFPELHENMRSS